MSSVFTRIIEGALPGRFVWRDERAVAFLTVAPLRPGHTLVVPTEEIDHWIDLPPELAGHLMVVSQAVGRAIQRAFAPRRIGISIVGDEVPHAHIHVVPIEGARDLEFRRADRDPDPRALDEAAQRIRDELAALGYGQVAGS